MTARSIDHYRENYTQQTAYNDVVPSYADNLQELASRQITGVGELQRQVESLTRNIGSLDASLPELTKQYQGQRMKFREACGGTGSTE
jgi:U3 small nucleolar ribonucleoprotein component